MTRADGPRKLDAPEIHSQFLEDAEHFSDCKPMLLLIEALRGRTYASDLWASRSHATLTFGTKTAQISVEYWSHADRFRVRYFENGRKLDSRDLHTRTETLNVIDALVIRAQMNDSHINNSPAS